MVNPKLKEYIEKNIFPLYQRNEEGHDITHIQYVIERSFELVEQNELAVDLDMVYAIAAYHDIGHYIDSKIHEIISAKIMQEDKTLLSFFNEKQLETIKQAIEDHRASSDHEPRSIYGKIVSSADRNDTVEKCLRRSYYIGKRRNPNYTDEQLFENAFQVLTKKFGENGYAKFYFKDKKYEDFLTQIRSLLQDKETFCNTQKAYIENLRKTEKTLDKR